MSSVPIKNVLFDLDGTFADTAPDLAFALNTLLREQNRSPLTLEEIRPYVSLGGIAMLRMAFNINEDSEEFEVLKAHFLDTYRNNIARDTKLFDGMEPLLTTLDENKIPWGIVTNKSTWLTEPLMHELNMHHRTPCIVCGDTLSVAKPNPEPMFHACSLLACEAHETLYVGDAQRDIEAGRRANMTTVIASYGYIDDNDDPTSWGADAAIESPLELLQWLDIP